MSKAITDHCLSAHGQLHLVEQRLAILCALYGIKPRNLVFYEPWEYQQRRMATSQPSAATREMDQASQQSFSLVLENS